MTAQPDIIAITTIPLAELGESWRTSLTAEGKSPQTIKAYMRGVQGFTGWHTSTYPDAEPVLDAASVRAYLADLRKAGQSPGTVRLRYSALRRFAAWLVAEGEIDRDPLLSMKAPALGKPMVDAVSDTQVDAMLKTCRGTSFSDRRDTALLLVLISTGIRAEELCALTVDDVDVPGRLIRIRHGKGNKERTAPLLDKITLDAPGKPTYSPAQAVDRYLRARNRPDPKTGRRHRLADTPAFWLGVQGKQFGYQGAARALMQRAETAGVQGFHLHRCRHSFAGRWLAAGGSEDSLMSIAGWSDRNMIQRYAATDRLKRAIEEAKRLNL